MKLLLTKILLYAFITAYYHQAENSLNITQKIDEYLLDKKPNKKKLRLILESGKVNGVFSAQEVQQIFEHLQQKNQNFVKIEIIGKTFLNKDLKAYHLSGDGFKNKQQKSQILFTGVHHAREILTTVMVVKIYLECLHSLIHSKDTQTFWKYNDLLIVPILNLDSYDFITSSYGTSQWNKNKLKRKNMNNKDCQQYPSLGGVDLNRNYSNHFGQDEQGNAPCSEIYRGTHAFSEPETQAIQNLLNNNPNVISAMNFHTYGNMWIHPFNYLTKGNFYPENIDQKFIDFYENFAKDVQEVSPGAKYGNAIEMVNYAADGEASDWMLGEKNIIAFSPELGSKNQNAQDFYIAKDLIFEVIEENYHVINRFLERNVFSLTDLDFGISKKNEFFIKFRNSGLVDLYNAKITIKGLNQNFLSQVQQITYQDQYKDIQTIENFDYKKLQKELTFTVNKINRLEEFHLALKVENYEILIQNFDLTMTIKMFNDNIVDECKIELSNIRIDYQIFTLYFLTGMCMAILFYLIFKLLNNYQKKKETQNLSLFGIKKQII